MMHEEQMLMDEDVSAINQAEEQMDGGHHVDFGEFAGTKCERNIDNYAAAFSHSSFPAGGDGFAINL